MACELTIVLLLYCLHRYFDTLRWRHNERDCVSNHQPNDCFLNCLFRGRSKKTSKLRVTGLCAGNSPGTGEFPAQMASNAENVSIWWRHHELILRVSKCIHQNQPNIIKRTMMDLYEIQHTLRQMILWPRMARRRGVTRHLWPKCS